MQKAVRDPYSSLLLWFLGFSTVPCRTNCWLATVSLALFKHQLCSPYPCTSAKNDRFGNLGHRDVLQCSWQKEGWLHRSEASLKEKKLFNALFFFFKGNCSFKRPQPTASTLSWNPPPSVVVWSCPCLESMGLFEPQQLVTQGFQQLLDFICFLEFASLKMW